MRPHFPETAQLRGLHVPIFAETETRPDYELTARLATQAFAPENALRPGRFQWLYERAFGGGTTVVALNENGRKIGHFAMVRQTLLVDGREETAAQLSDLFIIPGHRGRQRMEMLYDTVAAEFLKQRIRFAIGMPNAKAIGVNEHFFGLKPFRRLPFHMGLSLPGPAARDLVSFRFDPANRTPAQQLFAQFCGRTDNGLLWTGPSLAERLCGPDHEYGVHTRGHLLLISSPRRSRNIDYTLLCGFFVRPGGRASVADVHGLVNDACRMWGRRLYVYIGLNRQLPILPGVPVPARLRPSPMLIQLRDFMPDQAPLSFHRYELLDFDFA